MGKFIDLTGQRFGKLTVVKIDKKSNDGHYKWLCKCDCGAKKSILGKSLNSGKTKSCGCLIREKTINRNLIHNMSKTRIYSIWIRMKKSCYSKNNSNYKHYGGRGIRICDEWLDKENGFMNFYNWAINNGYREDLSIDRIDVNGNYEPINCRWADAIQQANNRTNNHYIIFNEEKHTMTEWSRILNISYATLKTRARKNLPYELLLSKGKVTPTIRKKYKGGTV